MGNIIQKILAIKNETRYKSIIPVQVGNVLLDLNSVKSTRYEGPTDPADNPDNEIKNGDRWINGCVIYERINGEWVDKTTQITGGSPKTIKDVDNDLDIVRQALAPRKQTFTQTDNPAEDAENNVSDGDVWIYTGSPLTKYERIDGVWVSLSGSGGGVSTPSIFTVNTVNFKGNPNTIFNFNGDKNFIIKSK